MLPRQNGESWIELYRHLLMLRSRLTFDQLIGRYVEYQEDEMAIVKGKKVEGGYGNSHAICGNHVMRAGKHWATFTTSSSDYNTFQTVGVIRPLPGWETRELDAFCPAYPEFHADLLRERTDRWEGDVNHCCFYMNDEYDEDSCFCCWFDWTGEHAATNTDWEGRDDYTTDCITLGMLLDLGEGTLSVYQNGRSCGTFIDGLAGEYCWIAGFRSLGDVSIQRGYNLNTL